MLTSIPATTEQVAYVMAVLPREAVDRDLIEYLPDPDGPTLHVPVGLVSVVHDAIAAFDQGAKMPVPVPQSVTRAQAKIALHRAKLLDMVKTAVGADPELQIWFDEAAMWERNNPHVVEMGDKLLGGAAEVDALFVAAAQIAA